jgi:hypothetical protein
MSSPSYTLRGRKPLYHPRGGRGSVISPAGLSTNVSLPSHRDIMHGLSQISLQTFSKPAASLADKQVEVTDLQYVGSYNWTDSASPTIIVPGEYPREAFGQHLINDSWFVGSPREWLDKPMPYQVHADDGFMFRDQGGFRCPSAVLLPLLTAVERTAEADGKTFEWSSVDFVTDRNSLRKLLRWIGGTALKDFRIDTQLAGERTVLLNRWETHPIEQMGGYTYGFNFEKASTRPAPGCEDGTGHHRIVRYVRICILSLCVHS